MDQLAKLLTSAAQGAGLQFRKHSYGAGSIRDFLRDTMAMANASVDGPRLIVVGVDTDDRDKKQVYPVSDKDFSGKPDYVKLVSDYIEPALNVSYEATSIDGKQVGVFRIDNCRDRPYMMRVDFSEELRRGDAYMRVNDAAIKMGRRQLQVLFEQRFRDSVSGDHVEVGFPGEIIHKHLGLACRDLDQLPSAVAASKLEELIKIQLNSRDTGSTSIMARLVHARLFGSDDPYVSRSPDELMQEMEQIRDKYDAEDREFLFETHAQRMQLVLYNQGHEPIVDASLALVLPNDPDLYIADRPPMTRTDGLFVECAPEEVAAYPAVNLLDNTIHIKCSIRRLPPGEPVDAFGSPLRLYPGPGLRGRKFGIRYSLQGRNLRAPAKGQLRLLFN